jgi:molybdate transport system substrate-binding protein
VRGALALVSRGESPLGIVYRTDALVDSGVVVVDTFPESSHPPVIYPVALLPPASAEGARVLAFLKTPVALAVFQRHGFTEPARD